MKKILIPAAVGLLTAQVSIAQITASESAGKAGSKLPVPKGSGKITGTIQDNGVANTFRAAGCCRISAT